MDNILLAKILIKNKIASEEVVKELWSKITPQKNIGQVLIDTGEIPEDIYPKLINAYKKRLAKQEETAKVSPSAPVAPQAISKVPPASPQGDLYPVTRAPKTLRPEEDVAPISKIASAIESVQGLEGSYISNVKIEEVQVESALALEQTSIGTFHTDIVAPSQLKAPISAAPISATKIEINKDTNQNLDTIITDPKAKKALPPLVEGDRGVSGSNISVPEKLLGYESLDEILAFARFEGATDIHLSSENPILLKKFGALVPVSSPLSTEQMELIIRSGVNDQEYDQFMQSGDLEKICVVSGYGRFRLTVMKQQRGYDLTARVIPNEILKLSDSGLPESAFGLTKWAQGLVLVTGPAGAGKTRTLSILVNEVIQSRKDHIITIESPIEIIYPPGPCQVTQREVGTSTQSQANALRAALRQDPDIIVVSELRDLESMELAISAAETGHLVFATMNTSNAMRTLSRLIDSFPPESQDIIRSMISESLRGVISQQLIPNKLGTGLATAFEVLLTTLPIANLIRKNEMHQLESAMITGRQSGMVLLDDSLKDLVEAGEIEGIEAYHRAVNPKNFERYLNG